MLAAEAGASTRELMRRLRQSTMRAALIYQHATATRDQEIAKEIDRRVRESRRRKSDQEDDDDGESDGARARVA
jgi:hypothetical protein